MDNQSIANAYYSQTTIEALLYENFDSKPQWRQVKIKEICIGVGGIDWLEVMILKDGWPTPWNATIAREKFSTDLREVKHE